MLHTAQPRLPTLKLLAIHTILQICKDTFNNYFSNVLSFIRN
jgi:hypothetical protein